MPEIVVRVSAADGSATETHTDSAGRFDQDAAPGGYAGQPIDESDTPTFFKLVDVKFPDRRIVDVVLHVDTGIR